MQEYKHRLSYIVGAILLAAMIVLAIQNAATFRDALTLMHQALPQGLVIAFVAIGAGFVCAGRVYGKVLATLGYRIRQIWLSAAALVAILISQTIPAGTLGSYAFLSASLRRRGIPAASVALVASLELLSWMGAMLLLFGYGLIYMVVTTGQTSATEVAVPAVAWVGLLLGGGLFIGSRPRTTLRTWALRVKLLLERMFGPLWTKSRVLRLVDELIHNRRLVMKRPGQVLRLVALQLAVFLLHSMALFAILASLGITVAPHAVLAAYGLSLIVSTFTVLPGGGGTVEAALTLALNVQGIPLNAALGAAILFRLLSFWLLLPVGAICYRVLLTRHASQSSE